MHLACPLGSFVYYVCAGPQVWTSSAGTPLSLPWPIKKIKFFLHSSSVLQGRMEFPFIGGRDIFILQTDGSARFHVYNQVVGSLEPTSEDFENGDRRARRALHMNKSLNVR